MAKQKPPAPSEPIPWCRRQLAAEIARHRPRLEDDALDSAACRFLLRALFLRMCESRTPGVGSGMRSLLEGDGVQRRLMARLRRAEHLCGVRLADPLEDASGRGSSRYATPTLGDAPLRDILRRLFDDERLCDPAHCPADRLGGVYEQMLAQVVRRCDGDVQLIHRPDIKKAGGVFYTPAKIVRRLVGDTMEELLNGKTPTEAQAVKILDPSCGAGSFLVGVYQHLLDWHQAWYVADGAARHAALPEPKLYAGPDGEWRLTLAERRRILHNSIYGVDLDDQAVEVAQLALMLQLVEGGWDGPPPSDDPATASPQAAILERQIRCGNALVGSDFVRRTPVRGEETLPARAVDWETEFPEVFGRARPGFDAVIGNPPWGQKAVVADPELKRYLRHTYPSSRGIFDLFRPFVERAVRLTRPSGVFAMVLPDILLLKDYSHTRKLILDELAINAIEWWGQAFDRAVIDAVTIVGKRASAAADHGVRVAVRDAKRPVRHTIPQRDFLANPRHAFNLRMTREKQALVDQLLRGPRLQDFFEVHEGVHSGNIRRELFVERRLDASCRELLFGRDEIAPYRLCWKGKYVRLGAMPVNKNRGRYANLGQAQWHESEKVVVRRTGDFVLAGVDRHRRYVSNNFFVVLPLRPCALNLDGLCALLNSRLITWYFRTIEPREGRVFAELKIKHMRVFPLPTACEETRACDVLNDLGAQRIVAAAPQSMAEAPRRLAKLDRQIDTVVGDLFGLDEKHWPVIEDADQPPALF